MSTGAPTPVGWTACVADVLARERIGYRLPELWVRFSGEDVVWQRVQPSPPPVEPVVVVGRTADGRVMGVRVAGVDRG